MLVVVMIKVRVSLQTVNIKQCNVLQSHVYTTVCVCVQSRSLISAVLWEAHDDPDVLVLIQ